MSAATSSDAQAPGAPSLGARAAEEKADRWFLLLATTLTVAVLGFLVWLLMLREVEGESADLRFVPGLNAALNAVAASCLVAGFFAIRRGNQKLHRALMVSAFSASCMFLVGYVLYHYVHGDTRYEGDFRPLYLVILITHILASVPIMPMAMGALYTAWRKRFTWHKRLNRVLLPLWLYVSISGIVVYFMLHR